MQLGAGPPSEGRAERVRRAEGKTRRIPTGSGRFLLVFTEVKLRSRLGELPQPNHQITPLSLHTTLLRSPARRPVSASCARVTARGDFVASLWLLTLFLNALWSGWIYPTPNAPGAWDESGNYTYNPRGQVTSEGFSPAPATSDALAYVFDHGPSQWGQAETC
jgi:hypothetical protein